MQGYDGIRDRNGNYHNEIDLHFIKSHSFLSFLPLHSRTLLFLRDVLARFVIEWLLVGKVFLQLVRLPLRDPESSLRLSPRWGIPPSVFYWVKCSTISVGH
ncbi:hypothetical protein CGCSCA5_v014305 [Colletotrichum siamense]|nr:hypothetical protein CGCSCA5_v014305 [Colletotrichum siamense]KAF4869738.1 hypothetical protein CGCSCA1_v011040 [Colletotrichum siamense]